MTRTQTVAVGIAALALLACALSWSLHDALQLDREELAYRTRCDAAHGAFERVSYSRWRCLKSADTINLEGTR